MFWLSKRTQFVQNSGEILLVCKKQSCKENSIAMDKGEKEKCPKLLQHTQVTHICAHLWAENRPSSDMKWLILLQGVIASNLSIRMEMTKAGNTSAVCLPQTKAWLQTQPVGCGWVSTKHRRWMVRLTGKLTQIHANLLGDTKGISTYLLFL